MVDGRKKTVSELVELAAPHQTNKPTEAVCVKCSKSDIHRKTHCIPEIKFQDQRLTSFAELVVYQSLFSRIGLKQQLSGCFRNLTVSPIFGHGVVVMLLIVHLLLGYRRLQDLRYYQDDPVVRRLPGLERLPDVTTLTMSANAAVKSQLLHYLQVFKQAA